MEVSPLVTRMLHMQADTKADIEIAGETDSADGLEDALAAARADVVIWGVDARSLPRVRDVVVGDPSLKVLALETSEGAGVMVALRADLEQLPDLGAVELVDASRRAADRPSGLTVQELGEALEGALGGRAAC